MTDDLDGTARRDARNDLDCIHCGRWLPTFDRLAAHMAARHGRPTPSNRQPGDIELPAATGRPRVHFPKGARPMSKKKNASKFPAPPESKKAQATGTSDRNPFLKAEHIGPEGTVATVKIVADSVRMGPSAFGSGEQVIVTVTHKGKAYDFGMDPTKPNYRILYDAKGDPSTWTGTIPLKVLSGTSDYLAVQRIK